MPPRRAGAAGFAPAGPALLADAGLIRPPPGGRGATGWDPVTPEAGWLRDSAFRGLPSPGPRDFRGLRAPEPWFFPAYPPSFWFSWASPAQTRGLPPAGPLLDAQKWAEKPLGRPQTPSFCPIGHLQGKYLVATETPRAAGLLVIGLVGNQLRLSALGMIGTSR